MTGAARQMLPSDYRVVRYDSSLKGHVLALQRHLWSRDLDLNAAYFAWKYKRNPYLAEPWSASCSGRSGRPSAIW